jgi:hypothetical protein
MHEDPIVAEVHKVRREILARFGGDVDAYSRYIQNMEAEKRKRGVYYREVPARGDVPKPDAA